MTKRHFLDNVSEIPDEEYDQLVLEFEKLEDKHPDLAKTLEFHDKPVPIHDPVAGGLQPVKMNTPMQGLKKSPHHAGRSSVPG